MYAPTSGVAIGKRMDSESRKATAGAVLGVGGLATVKGATERQYRLRQGINAAQTHAASMGAKAERAHATAAELKGKSGAFIRNPAGQNTRHRFGAEAARRAAQNISAGADQAHLAAGAAKRNAVKPWRNAQRAKVGGLAALATGTYLGVKGVSGMNRNRRERAIYGA